MCSRGLHACVNNYTVKDQSFDKHRCGLEFPNVFPIWMLVAKPNAKVNGVASDRGGDEGDENDEDDESDEND